MKRRTVLAGLGSAATVGTAGCLGAFGGGCDVDEFQVGMTASAFQPEEVTVDVGTEVVWLNNSDRAHTVTAYDSQIPADADFFASGGFESTQAARDAWDGESGAIYTCETYSHTFEVPGEYNYVCLPHEAAGMVGTVVVEE